MDWWTNLPLAWQVDGLDGVYHGELVGQDLHPAHQINSKLVGQPTWPDWFLFISL